MNLKRIPSPQCWGTSQPCSERSDESSHHFLQLRNLGEPGWHPPQPSVGGQGLAEQQKPCPEARSAPHSHLRHGLRQVSRDGSKAFATAVHDATATGAHGWAGAGREGAGGHSCGLPLACRDSGRDIREPYRAAASQICSWARTGTQSVKGVSTQELPKGARIKSTH